jgi:hypothetical protein
MLITGGYDKSELPQASAERYNATTQQFTATGSMSIGRATHAAARLLDGRVLVTGGLVPTGHGVETDQSATAEIFDPSTGTFTATGGMTVARFNHSAITLDDGRVLVLGGNQRRSAEVFDPHTGMFTALPDMKAVYGRGHQAVKLLSGKVLVVGGDSGSVQATAAAEVFDPVSNTFTLIFRVPGEWVLMAR